MNIKKDSVIYVLSDTACSSFTARFSQQASEEVCVSVGSLVCVLPCVLWLILWLWWAAAVHCETSTSANQFVSQQWWCKCRCVCLWHFERMCGLKLQFIFDFIGVFYCLKWHFCGFVRMKELVTHLSVNGLCLSAVIPTFSVYPTPPSSNLMLNYVSQDI